MIGDKGMQSQHRIEKLNFLDPGRLSQVKSLVERSASEDGYLTPIHWDTVMSRTGTLVSEFLYYIDQKLVGWISLYRYVDHELTLSAVVDAEQRGKGIFVRLFQNCLEVIKHESLSSCLFLVHPKSEPAKKVLKSIKAKYQYSEQLLQVDLSTLVLTEPTYVWREVKPNDLEALIALEADGFTTHADDIKDHLTDMIVDARYMLMGCYYKEGLIAKAHIKKNEETSMMSSFCLKSDWQQQHRARSILNDLFEYLRQQCIESVQLEVDPDEQPLLSLYQSVGFDVIATYEYWHWTMSKNKKPGLSTFLH